MPKIDRQLFRKQMKKEYKKFIKENAAYKHMLFSEFVELVKINMLKLKKEVMTTSVLDGHTHDHAGHDHDHGDHELQDMFTSVTEETDETTTTE